MFGYAREIRFIRGFFLKQALRKLHAILKRQVEETFLAKTTVQVK